MTDLDIAEKTPSLLTQQDLTSAIAADYETTPKPTLQALSKKYNLHPLTVRKHLVTAGVYDTTKTNLVLSALKVVLEQSVSSDQIVAEVEKKLSEKKVVISTQTIYSYLPYDITASGMDAAERKRLQRERVGYGDEWHRTRSEEAWCVRSKLPLPCAGTVQGDKEK